MITIPAWLLAIPATVILVLAAFLLYALVRSEDLADRRLQRELYHPPVVPVNPQKAQDTSKVAGSRVTTTPQC